MNPSMSLVGIAARYPYMIFWLERHTPYDQLEVYQLLDTIGYREPTEYEIRRNGEVPADIGPYASLMKGDGQWLTINEDDDDALFLASTAERNAFRTLVEAYLEEPNWDRETYEAYEYAMSKDD